MTSSEESVGVRGRELQQVTTPFSNALCPAESWQKVCVLYAIVALRHHIIAFKCTVILCVQFTSCPKGLPAPPVIAT